MPQYEERTRLNERRVVSVVRDPVFNFRVDDIIPGGGSLAVGHCRGVNDATLGGENLTVVRHRGVDNTPLGGGSLAVDHCGGHVNGFPGDRGRPGPGNLPTRHGNGRWGWGSSFLDRNER